MNRQQRRAQKHQPQTAWNEEVYKEGFRDGSSAAYKMAYAAVCLIRKGGEKAMRAVVLLALVATMVCLACLFVDKR